MDGRAFSGPPSSAYEWCWWALTIVPLGNPVQDRNVRPRQWCTLRAEFCRRPWAGGDRTCTRLKRGESAWDEFDHAIASVNVIAGQAPGISRALMPLVIANLGLPKALALLPADFQKYHQIPVSQDIDDVSGLFTSEAQVMLYHTVQECLTTRRGTAKLPAWGCRLKRRARRFSLFVKMTASVSTRRQSGPGLAVNWGWGSPPWKSGCAYFRAPLR
jgi:hypothetical protein